MLALSKFMLPSTVVNSPQKQNAVSVLGIDVIECSKICRIKLDLSNSLDLMGTNANEMAIRLIHKLLKDLYQRYEGVVIGEAHNNAYSKTFLIEHMQTLKEAGVTTLFFEFLCYETMQDLLDGFFDNKYGDIPLLFKTYLTSTLYI